MNGKERFHLEINSIGEFITFVMVIRGGNLDLEKLKQLTQELNQSSDPLKKAVEENT